MIFQLHSPTTNAENHPSGVTIRLPPRDIFKKYIYKIGSTVLSFSFLSWDSGFALARALDYLILLYDKE